MSPEQFVQRWEKFAGAELANAGCVREVLTTLGSPPTAEGIARHFTRAPKAAVAELLDTLVTVGQARQLDVGRYAVQRAA